MAALSNHGTELYRYETLTARIAHMSDGHILKNTGLGWKLWRKVKDGVSPQEVASDKRERNAKLDAEQPSYVALRNWFQDNVPFDCRWLVLQTVEMMPGDVDGWWSTFDDSYGTGLRGRLTFEDCQELHRLHQAVLMEKKLKAEGALA